MRVAGIIAECNPFHKGHGWLLRQARRETGADYIVVALSGDYVQRGEPAIIGWEPRVRAILDSGADLVVSLPLYVSCCGTDYFARGSVTLLDSLGVVTDLVFGSETGDLDSIQKTGSYIAEEPAAFGALLKEALKKGLPYPAAREQAIRFSIANSTGFPGSEQICNGPKADSICSSIYIPATPNDLLGVEYCKTLAMNGSTLRPHAVRRIPCESASSIRRKLLVSAQTDEAAGYPGQALLCCDDFSDALLEALLPHFSQLRKEEMSASDNTHREHRQFSNSSRHSAEESGERPLSAYLDVSEDLARRILRELPRYDGFTDFCSCLKTRNVTYTHITRALLHILLQMTEENMQTFDSQFGMCAWIRPLGFRRTAAPLLRAITGSCTVPFLDKLSRAGRVLSPAAQNLLEQELRGELLYDMIGRKKYSCLHKNSSEALTALPPVYTAAQKKPVILP